MSDEYALNPAARQAKALERIADNLETLVGIRAHELEISRRELELDLLEEARRAESHTVWLRALDGQTRLTDDLVPPPGPDLAPVTPIDSSDLMCNVCRVPFERLEDLEGHTCQ